MIDLWIIKNDKKDLSCNCQMKTSLKNSLFAFCGWLLLIVYIAFIVYITMISRFGRYMTGVNLIPFKSYYEAMGNHNMHLWFNIIANIILFMPFGLLLPTLFSKLRTFLHVVLTGFCISMAIEVLQIIFHFGMFDVDDIINNTIGSLIGCSIYFMIKHIRNYISR